MRHPVKPGVTGPSIGSGVTKHAIPVVLHGASGLARGPAQAWRAEGRGQWRAGAARIQACFVVRIAGRLVRSWVRWQLPVQFWVAFFRTRTTGTNGALRAFNYKHLRAPALPKPSAQSTPHRAFLPPHGLAPKLIRLDD